MRAVPDRAGRGRGPGGGHHGRRRRLRDQTVQPGRGAGPAARPAPPGQPDPGADRGLAGGRRPDHGRRCPRGPPGRRRPRTDRDRVRAAQVAHAQPQAGAVQGADPGPGVELRLRRPGPRRGALHQLPAEEDRRRPGAAHSYGARGRVRTEARWLMSGSSASPARGLTRLAALFSLRTISGKLIIGLALLFGVASVAVSVVTDQSLNQSLMSSLNQQLQTATDTWYGCVFHSTSDPDHDTPRPAAYQSARPGYGMCSNGGQAPGTFEVVRSEEHTSELQSREKLVCRL